MQQAMLQELNRLIAELKQKEEAAVYTVPQEAIGAVKKAKHLEKFLLDLFDVVNGGGGIDIRGIIRREFGLSKMLTDRMDRWAAYGKELLEDELHEAIDRAEIRAGKQHLFFVGPVGKQVLAEALGLLKQMAHAAVRLQFHPGQAGSGVYVAMLDPSLRFYELPSAQPDENMSRYRLLIASGRLHAMSGNDESIAADLKAHVKQWYQNGSLTFLEQREWHLSYEHVPEYLYALTADQIERLQDDFMRHISEEFALVKAKPELYRAEQLKKTLEAVLSWADDAEPKG
ncbi:hypothetical protein ACFQI7_23910 [Paenibacillus allorhizosphaerae]|uniref:Uncharacterized protein n=1 Tax=Paenibacillus allorhizosphaerae TaxID=2849866 RepID=A0ABM8VK66_9BACL|nr:hypothetical protein [Paenibacillus allorhizosphaerae]CAG7646576.1 hypothetical protein PAECIP111802_03781 [Paenibacillus allorhizosphaerae]